MEDGRCRGPTFTRTPKAQISLTLWHKIVAVWCFIWNLCLWMWRGSEWDKNSEFGQFKQHWISSLWSWLFPPFFVQKGCCLYLPKLLNFSTQSGNLLQGSTNVVPVFKKGDSRLPSNYRPISLTSIYCQNCLGLPFLIEVSLVIIKMDFIQIIPLFLCCLQSFTNI